MATRVTFKPVAGDIFGELTIVREEYLPNSQEPFQVIWKFGSGLIGWSRTLIEHKRKGQYI